MLSLKINEKNRNIYNKITNIEKFVFVKRIVEKGLRHINLSKSPLGIDILFQSGINIILLHLVIKAFLLDIDFIVFLI